MSKKTVALIVAAGRGSRARLTDNEAPKQYLPLLGRSVLSRTISTFLNCPAIDLVLPVIHGDDEAAYHRTLEELEQSDCERLADPVIGGADRRSSVFAGLEELALVSPEVVLIHDGVRPFVSVDLIERVINVLKQVPAVLPGWAVVETVKRTRNAIVSETVDRSGLFLAQTPQGFDFATIYKAHSEAEKQGGHIFTDDSSIAEWYGIEVKMIEGEETNLKLTTREDFQKGVQILKTEKNAENNLAGRIRIGNGFDVHAFEAGEQVTLCGIQIPFHKQLKGHSDADVGLHAVTDAIYGALGAGDIGQHFPPSDDSFKGMASEHFLSHAMGLVEAEGAMVSNIDLTLVCEAPKIGPHRRAMVNAIAAITGLEAGCISVKATTSEKLGFTGREEGIAALASVILTFEG